MLQESEIITRWLEDGHACCLAIVTKTWGSAPRSVGSLMVIRGDGVFEGSVSGGCVEGAVISESIALIKSKSISKMLSFSVANEDAWQVGLACGGEIEILLVHISIEKIDIFKEAHERILNRQDFSISLNTVDKDIKLGASAKESGFEDKVYHLSIAPRRQIIIVGAVHIAQKLCEVAVSADYDVVVIDPRAAFIDSRNFKGAAIVNDWPDEFLAAYRPDNQTALAVLTHDPKIDDLALKAALSSDVFYIGALGSLKTHASRIERLTKEGIDTSLLSKIKGPIGLNIGAKSPAEIAIAIMAEITLAYRGAKPRDNA
jgi:xanthine dehydrogenase accessory factor